MVGQHTLHQIGRPFLAKPSISHLYHTDNRTFCPHPVQIHIPRLGLMHLKAKSPDCYRAPSILRPATTADPLRAPHPRHSPIPPHRHIPRRTISRFTSAMA